MTNFQMILVIILGIWGVVFPLAFLVIMLLALRRDSKIQNPQSKIV